MMPSSEAVAGNQQEELSRRHDGSALVGYLNFSDGRVDAKFRKGLSEACGILESVGTTDLAGTMHDWLTQRAAQLEQSGSAAFKDLSQAKTAIVIAFAELPKAYREHHKDLLLHQPDAQLFNAFFLARCCEITLDTKLPTLDKKLAKLNDFVGYRPIALLETRAQTEFYPHERVCAVPLYWRGIGAAPGPYADVIRPAIELLEATDPNLLDEASFELAKLEEIALDPRAIDHFHPVNKRPSVLFGEWDPHRIDGKGFYSRFVLRQSTLDALMRWVHGEKWPHTTGLQRPDSERLFEAAAALCGTILMGAGVSGSGPTYHDSDVTLTGLVANIARYRDEFYKQLLNKVPGTHGVRLKDEATRFRQPFATVRQYLNQSIAADRALHLQERRLALLFASMGYPVAARLRAANIPAPATRFSTEIRLKQTDAHFANERNKPGQAVLALEEAEDLLRRGINCGVLLDPWNILGFQGLFPIFPGRDDTVRDPRCEDLILTVGRQFELYAQSLSLAAAGTDRSLENRLREGMKSLAEWWDRFATTTVTEMPRVQGQERTESAEHVSRATALWRTGGATDPAFWRKHRDGFRTPAAFAQVIEALLDHKDHKASMALLVTWLSESETVPLQDPSASFFKLAFRWVNDVVLAEAVSAADRSALLRRFFELMEVNAEERWTIPVIGTLAPKLPTGADQGTDEEEALDEDEEDSPYSSAYENMSFRDSADDGQEGPLAEGGGVGPTGDFALDGEAEIAENRLRFIAGIARLWRLAAMPSLWDRNDAPSTKAIGEWLQTAREWHSKLRLLAAHLGNIDIPEATSGVEGVMEFDRRRAIRGALLELTVQTCVETNSASRGLSALLSRNQSLTGGNSIESLLGESSLPIYESLAIRLEKAIAEGNRALVRKMMPGFITVFGKEPLLVSPLADGGDPSASIRAQSALQIMESYFARLPRLGLLRETYQLLKLSRTMERNDPPEGRRVSSFDQIFRSAVTGIVDSLILSSKDWGEDTGEDSPTAVALKQMSDSFRALWVDHSLGLRLSSLETALEKEPWESLKNFIRRYGNDLFTVRFLTLSNIRGILGQGGGVWLDRQYTETEDYGRLVQEVAEKTVDRTQTIKQFELVLHCLVEHYDEYRDYNTTTTQSDYGENLYILLDFLRLKVAYDRFAWRLRPMILAHEVLCRRGFDRLAAKWRELIASQSESTSKELLEQLTLREHEHAVKLRTIRDRLEERFVHPLRIDQAAARMARAALAAKEGQPEDNPAFAGLLTTIQPLAEQPSGVGLDVPVWLRRLENELRKVRTHATEDDDLEDDEQYPYPATTPVDFADLQQQLRDWEKPLSE
ncbi:MAG: hypothetical protein ACRC8S_17595 [Fimbriiglobus sp.]